MTKRQTKNLKTPNSYTSTRYNAMKHGALSCMLVLPWEDANEFVKLREALIQAHQPQGASEEHLVIEMTNCIFRKQRIYKAENALMVQRMRSSSSYYLKRDADLLVPNIATKLSHHSNELNFKEVLYNEGLDQEYDQDFITHQKYLSDVQAIIDSDLSYQDMLEQCPVDAIESWRDWLKDNNSGYVESKQSFKGFLQTEIIDWCEANLDIKQALPQLKQQLVGLSYIPCDKMDSLQRHEAALDRRFEKNLAMLLKLQEVRKPSAAAVIADTVENSVL